MADESAAVASVHLLRLLVRQNEEALRRFRSMPPLDWESPNGRQHLMSVQELRDQSVLLNERLEWLASNPSPPRRRRTWRDLAPAAHATSG